MCGINGILNFKCFGDHSDQVKRMNNALAHRGPDDEGIYTATGIALGHRRLSIIDLSAAGHQPMSFDNGRYHIVYNGELYNFRELKNELKEFEFRTNSDTEVILASFVKWQEKCLEKFNGMFAFAIWDNKVNSLFMVRDRLGIKPLYYFSDQDTFIFSSEVRSLMASGRVPGRIDRVSLQDYLRYQTVHAPATIIENVKMLMPGHYMSIKGSSVEIQQWWRPDETTVIKEDISTAKKKVREFLLEAVERRLVADVPFGAFLSGGIDSSAIVALMTEVSSAKVKTFNVNFDESEFSEAKYASLVAKKFGTEHHEIRLTPDDFLKELMPSLDAMDHPSGDGPNTYIVSRATRNAGVAMALSGLGGDELFCGYDIFRRTLELESNHWLRSTPRSIRSAGGKLLSKLKPGVASDKKASILNLDSITFTGYYPINRKILSDEQVDLIAERGKGRRSDPVFNAAFATNFRGSDPNKLSKVSIAEITTYMQNVLLRDTDQMSMAHALEVRVPFLDYKLVEYVLSLPDDIKYPSTPKKLLVDSLGDLLPREIVDRPKMGFTFPWKHWMKNELKAFCEERLKHLGERKYFNPNGIDLLWRKFLADDPRVTWSRIWPLVVLSYWLQKNRIND